MNLLENLKNIIEKAKEMSAKDLEAWRYSIMFLVVVDMFGVFWYLGLKRLGIAIMIFLVLALAVILLLERRLPTQENQKEAKMSEEKPEEKKKEEEEEKEEDSFGLGLPDPEEYQKRLKKAIEG